MLIELAVSAMTVRCSLALVPEESPTKGRCGLSHQSTYGNTGLPVEALATDYATVPRGDAARDTRKAGARATGQAAVRWIGDGQGRS